MTQTQSQLAAQNSASSSTASGVTTALAPLTPVVDTTPAIAVASNELSGAQWVGRFPTSASTDDLEQPFRSNAEAFINAMRVAGATVLVSATLRPPERAYLMHWCWKISKQNANPQQVPASSGVSIEWAHNDASGAYSETASRAAATAMVNGYGMQNLQIAPALNSKHIQGVAIDMSISWSGNLTINNASGTAVTITSSPRTGMNTDLAAVGATYGVIKFVGGDSDKPHWSDDGH